jgi:DNA-binding NarL/FixJ family response regulator
VAGLESPQLGGSTILGVSARVLVVGANRIVRQGIRAELAANGANVVAEAGTGAEAIAALSEHHPDVVLLDYRLPDRPWPELCAAILSRAPETAVIVLSAENDERAAESALSSGARGFLVTDATDLDLPRAIQRVLAGESVVDPRSAAQVDSRRPEDPKLSSQELNVVRLVAEGLTNPEIGERLHLSRHTVKEYLSHAMRKLEAGNRIEAVRRATQLGLIEGVRPSQAGEAPRPETVVYNEGGGPILSSELKVTPLKIDKLEGSRKGHRGRTTRGT